MNEQSFEEAVQRFLEEIKREDEMTEKQRRILQAAIKLFADKGYHATSTSEIAKEAEVAEGTIFRHYKSKKDILIAVVAPMILKFAAPFILKDVRTMIREQSGKPFAEVLTNLYRNRLELVEANQKHLRIVIQEAFFHDEIREAMVQSVAMEGRKLIRAFVEQKMEAGELRPLPPEVVVRMLLGAGIGMVVYKYAVAPDEYREIPEEEQIAWTVDILMNGLAKR